MPRQILKMGRKVSIMTLHLGVARFSLPGYSSWIIARCPCFDSQCLEDFLDGLFPGLLACRHT